MGSFMVSISVMIRFVSILYDTINYVHRKVRK